MKSMHSIATGHQSEQDCLVSNGHQNGRLDGTRVYSCERMSRYSVKDTGKSCEHARGYTNKDGKVNLKKNGKRSLSLYKKK